VKILLTGAFGNVGTSTLEELVKRDHIIRCFDIPTRQNKRTARKFKKYNDKLEIIWGDLRNPIQVYDAVKGIDVVIHLAAIIPPLANQHPEIAEPVNVGGTRNIINAIKKMPRKAKLIFSSSVATYGDVRHKGCDYVIKVTDEFNPSPHDEYAKMKVRCEKMIRESGLNWAIFRFAAIPPMDQGIDPLMFEVPLDTPIEMCHTKDTGLAMANASENNEIWGKILHIAGGESCRVPFSEYVGRMLEAMGIGRLPDEAFSDEPFHCGYMDTTESQRLLKYQRYSYEDYVQETKKRYSFAQIFIKIFRPAIRYHMLRMSPHYRAYLKTVKHYMKPRKQGQKTKAKNVKTQPIDTIPSKTGK
jgi:nucleoside-diphosphate-sugar epimerase